MVAVVEAWGQFRNTKEGNIRRWKPEPSNAVKIVTEVTSL